MKNLLAVLLVSLAGAAAAETTTLGGSPFALPTFSRISLESRASRAIPVARARAVDGANDVSMFPIDGKSSLLGFSDDPARARAAAAHWAAILSAAGLKPGAPVFSEGSYEVPYASPDGRVVRRFMADAREFAPKDPAALEADKALIETALRKAGLTIIADPDMNIADELPTYCVYYLTAAADQPEHETQARVLANGDDIDFDLLQAAGLDIVSTPKTWLMVYVGPRISFVGSVAPTREEAQRKLDKRVEYLRGQGLRIIGTRISEQPDEDPEFRFWARVYVYL